MWREALRGFDWVYRALSRMDPWSYPSLAGSRQIFVLLLVYFLPKGSTKWQMPNAQNGTIFSCRTRASSTDTAEKSRCEMPLPPCMMLDTSQATTLITSPSQWRSQWNSCDHAVSPSRATIIVRPVQGSRCTIYYGTIGPPPHRWRTPPHRWCSRTGWCSRPAGWVQSPHRGWMHAPRRDEYDGHGRPVAKHISLSLSLSRCARSRSRHTLFRHALFLNTRFLDTLFLASLSLNTLSLSLSLSRCTLPWNNFPKTGTCTRKQRQFFKEESDENWPENAIR